LRLLEEGAVRAALEQFESVLKMVPDLAVAYRYAGIAAIKLEEFDVALDYLILALHYDGMDGVAAISLAQEYLRRNQIRLAISTLENCANNASAPEVIFELSRLKYEQEKFDESVELLRRNLTLHPAHIDSLNLLGLILAREFGRLEEGEAHIRLALQKDPGFHLALSNLGWVLSEQSRFDEAFACFDKVLDRNPGDSETRVMRAYTSLKRGDFLSGWRDYHARHASPLAGARKFKFRHALPEDDLSEKRTLVFAEQGLGDQIMFASCFPDLLATGANCTFECDSRLHALFQRSFPNAQVISEDDSRISQCEFDFQLACGDLPGRFRLSAQSFPLRRGYLQPDAEKVSAWRGRFEALGPGPYVGVSWMGGAAKTRRQLRTIPLPCWTPIFGQRAQFVSLQYGNIQADLQMIHAQGLDLHHWPEALADYDETAAMVYALDLVISVCTAVVHLAGALGKQVWVMVPVTAEWRYLADGEYMPWYPSARMFRQIHPATWAPTIESVAESLGSVIEASDKNGHILPTNGFRLR
jgi:tetratricopeptide (TPR) repeat protein